MIEIGGKEVGDLCDEETELGGGYGGLEVYERGSGGDGGFGDREEIMSKVMGGVEKR